jgi:cysteine synthase A
MHQIKKRLDHILETVGRTPVVRINRLGRQDVALYAKLEAFNPLGSVKDRLALGVIEEAESAGALEPGQTVVEATSGNTGIGLAMVCAAKGYPLVIVMAENFSIERRKIMRFLGAKVVLTPAPLRGTGMLAKAVELAETHGWFLCRQFENEANARMHYRTTGREIVDAFDGERLDYWVTGFGTGGTWKGVARALRESRPQTKIVIVEPDNSRLLGSGIAQRRLADGTPADSHPAFRTHPIQGWSPDFIPKLAEEAVAEDYADEIVPVRGSDALHFSRELARKEGIFTGISGGATLAGALHVCDTAPAGSSVLCMLPDTGERYLSTPLFDDVSAEMSGEEVEISRSTPNYRFDVAACALPSSVAGEDGPVATAEDVAFVSEAIDDPERPVVMFALEWCEFCWAVRKLLGRLGVEFRSIDLDTAEMQRDDRGGRLRSALRERIGSRTVPQLFVAGDCVGGCTEVFEACRSGRLHELLAAAGVVARPLDFDPGALLPGWLQRS